MAKQVEAEFIDNGFWTLIQRTPSFPWRKIPIIVFDSVFVLKLRK
jgi:hypothetical protein